VPSELSHARWLMRNSRGSINSGNVGFPRILDAKKNSKAVAAFAVF
jgi:hypothetical protein